MKQSLSLWSFYRVIGLYQICLGCQEKTEGNTFVRITHILKQMTDFSTLKIKIQKLYKLGKGNDGSILWNSLPGNTVSLLYPITCLWSSGIHKYINFPTTFSFKGHFPFSSISISVNWRHRLINYMSLWLWSWKSKPQDTSISKADYPKNSYRFEKSS